MTVQRMTGEARAPYGRHSQREQELAVSDGPYQGPTYYGKPALKPGHYKWLIIEYFFVGGIAGGAQILATAADLAGTPSDRVVVRHGRYLALAGAVISPVLLIADLYTPQRFYNMLRIYRSTSPMSFGAWTLAAFGVCSGFTAAAQIAEDLSTSRRGAAINRGLGRLASLPATAMAVVMTYYTGTLLSTTSVPLWAAIPRQLPALFGASALANAAAALTLCATAAGARSSVLERLQAIHAISGAAELVIGKSADHVWREEGVDGPLKEPVLGSTYTLGAVGLGIVVPLAIHAVQKATGRKSRTASTVAAVSTLAGGFLLRTAIVMAGRASAQRPKDYFHFAQPQREALARSEAAQARITEDFHEHASPSAHPSL